jgi:hypothetical protein
MSDEIVQYTLDHKNPIKLSKEAAARLDAMTDEDIDYSDIPELTDKQWKNAKITRSPFKKE